MNAGALRHRCWIKAPTVTTVNGAVTTTWGTSTVFWGSLEPLRGREWFESHLENADITARLRMRYYSGIEPTMQVHYGTRTWEIVSVIDPGERHQELELMLRELVHV